MEQYRHREKGVLLFWHRKKIVYEIKISKYKIKNDIFIAFRV